ncbi:MAG: 2-hydroxychromene-2-carboxylate isomerase [Pseudomonadota bacterium]|nr:2-hydroxychromene-2-carboxylate isomerase [Pseudomonadota bacterium]
MSRKLEYFFDCSSPWTYLSFRGILELRKNKEFEIIWKPILVGGIFNSTNPSVYESRKNPVKEKMEYSQKDMADWAAERNIQFNWPKIFPINSVKSMRGSFYFLDKNKNIEEYIEKVFKAYWTEGKDISSNDCLKDIVTSLSASADDFMEFIDLPETKKRLVDNTQELMDRNGFGSPTFFLDTEDMYFGNDRIQLIENKL